MLRRTARAAQPDYAERPAATAYQPIPIDLIDDLRALHEKLPGPQVIAPAPDLMALVPDELKHDLVREVTERTIEAWHEARGLNTPEFSYVLHDRDTDDDYGMQMLHTHVFVAGTIENSLGERQSHRVDRQQVCTDRGGLEHDHIARQEFEQLLDRTLGREWRLLRDAKQSYAKRLSVQVAKAMDDCLEQVARGRDEAKSEVIRAALQVPHDLPSCFVLRSALNL